MKTISLHVPEPVYDALKSVATLKHVPVAALIRQAMAQYLEQEQRLGRSLLDIQAHDSGPLLSAWTRDEILDEMMER